MKNGKSTNTPFFRTVFHVFHVTLMRVIRNVLYEATAITGNSALNSEGFVLRLTILVYECNSTCLPRSQRGILFLRASRLVVDALIFLPQSRVSLSNEASDPGMGRIVREGLIMCKK